MAADKCTNRMAHKPKVKDEAKFERDFAAALAETRNPVTALKSAVDSNKDGRTTFGEMREHRWKISLLVIGVIIGSLITAPVFWLNFVTSHWIFAAACLVSFVAGMFFSWLFREDLAGLEESLEDKTIGELVTGVAATAVDAATTGDPAAAADAITATGAAPDRGAAQ